MELKHFQKFMFSIDFFLKVILNLKQRQKKKNLDNLKNSQGNETKTFSKTHVFN